MRKSGKKKKEADAIDEVEELLKLTQEDLLLKLTVNSNINSKSKFVPESSSQTNAIHPDLDRRFQALRSKPSKPNPKIKTTDDQDLFARFAALKGTDATTTSIVKNDLEDQDENEEDEVSKIINWAIDAARLDPSPSSDIDDDNDDSSDDDDDYDDSIDRKKKASKK